MSNGAEGGCRNSLGIGCSVTTLGAGEGLLLHDFGLFLTGVLALGLLGWGLSQVVTCGPPGGAMKFLAIRMVSPLRLRNSR